MATPTASLSRSAASSWESPVRCAAATKSSAPAHAASASNAAPARAVADSYVASQKFGGDWTEQKLQILDHYLTEYCKIFQVSPRAKYFDTIYVDAFAGSGLIEKRKALVDRQELFAEYRDGALAR